ncbi:MAG TPA: hypothetical protein VMB50_11360, partial [Myxococcales bacterium]|nr:hypothetical protein [Myxococcales bacterium]
VASDAQTGVQLFSAALGGSTLNSVAAISTAPGALGLAAASCGPDCIVASWADTADAGTYVAVEPQVAFVNASGCGVAGPVAAGDGFHAVAQPFFPTFIAAVASNGNSAVIAYIAPFASSSQILASYCTP